MDREKVLSQLEALLPLAAEWAAEQEARAEREGVPLSEQGMIDARKIGVCAPERVRLLRVEAVPVPEDAQLRAAAYEISFLVPETSALSLRYGIFLRWDCWGDREIIAHELVHTHQYERLGGFLPFLREYVQQCLTIGYANSPMELEAWELSARALKG